MLVDGVRMAAVRRNALRKMNEGNNCGERSDSDTDPERSAHRGDERMPGGFGNLCAVGAETVAHVEGGTEVVGERGPHVGRNPTDAIELAVEVGRVAARRDASD